EICGLRRGSDVFPNAPTEEFQLLGESEDRPGQSARPGAERRKALLRIRTTKGSAVHIEHRFVRRATAHIIGIAAFAIIDVEPRSIERMFDEALEQRDLCVL